MNKIRYGSNRIPECKFVAVHPRGPLSYLYVYVRLSDEDGYTLSI
jgi:hypothetical protein